MSESLPTTQRASVLRASSSSASTRIGGAHQGHVLVQLDGDPSLRGFHRQTVGSLAAEPGTRQRWSGRGGQGPIRSIGGRLLELAAARSDSSRIS